MLGALYNMLFSSIEGLSSFFEWCFTYDINLAQGTFTPIQVFFGGGLVIFAAAIVVKWVLDFIL